MPVVGDSAEPSTRSRVVFPEPFAPCSNTQEPREITRFTERIAHLPTNRRPTSAASMAGPFIVAVDNPVPPWGHAPQDKELCLM